MRVVDNQACSQRQAPALRPLPTLAQPRVSDRQQDKEGMYNMDINVCVGLTFRKVAGPT